MTSAAAIATTAAADDDLRDRLVVHRPGVVGAVTGLDHECRERLAADDDDADDEDRHADARRRDGRERDPSGEATHAHRDGAPGSRAAR